MNDKEMADDIRTKMSELEKAINTAVESGLQVKLDQMRVGRIGAKHPLICLYVDIAKVENL